AVPGPGEGATGGSGAPAAPPAMPLWRAWIPYLLVAGFLTVSRIPALGLRERLSAQAWDVPDLFGLPGLDYSFAWAYLPGIFPFLAVAVLTRWLHGMSGGAVLAAWRASALQVSKAVLPLVFGVALVQVMLRSSG